MTEFRIHPQLLADCHRLGRLPATHLLLHRNAALPWFILVPETPVLDLLDLDPALLGLILADCARVSAYIKADLGLPRVNLAAIGNLVPQLHLHVVGRAPGDICWPAPVWGHLPPGPPYGAERLGALVAGLARHCALEPTDAPARPSSGA